MDQTSNPESKASTRFAWCLYDFANSAFPTVIITAVYVLYFKGVVVDSKDPGYSDNLWGTANSIAAFLVFLAAPLLGAAADIAGKKRWFLTGFALLCIASTGALYFTLAGTIPLAIGLVVAAIVGYEGSLVFYNAFLPELVTSEKMGRLSGKGWALGYVGGLCCMLIMIAIVDINIRLVGPIVALWYLVFSVPVFALVKDATRPKRETGGPGILSLGARRLWTTLTEIRKYRDLVRFLIAYFFYNNAVITIIVFAVAFTGDSLGFTQKESIYLVIVLNVVAAPGALCFGWLADRIGAKRTLVISLLMWLVVVLGAEMSAWPGLFTASGAKSFFWGVAVLASLCIGAVQATSRSFVGQMAPPNRSAEFYGFMAFAGKGSAVLGPLVFGLASDIFDSQRVAVGTIGVFFVIGIILLLQVPTYKPGGEEGPK